jgi:hypothetical protein
MPLMTSSHIAAKCQNNAPAKPLRPSPIVTAGGITNPNSGEASYMRQPDVIITNIAMTLMQWVIRTQPG